jgi:hypothetical protein
VSVMWFLGFVALSETMDRYTQTQTFIHTCTYTLQLVWHHVTSIPLFHCLHNVQWKICNCYSTASKFSCYWNPLFPSYEQFRFHSIILWIKIHVLCINSRVK